MQLTTIKVARNHMIKLMNIAYIIDFVHDIYSNCYI